MGTSIPPEQDSPQIPLSPSVKAAYVALNAKIEEAIESSPPLDVLVSLNAAQTEVDEVLSEDTEAELKADTALFNDLKSRIDAVSTRLKDLKVQLAGIASDISVAGDVIEAIDKVLSLLPGA
jgi:hypothetical protein